MPQNKLNFGLIFTLLLCLHALVVFEIDLFPFADVPSHLAEGVIFKYYNQNSNLFSKYYTLHYLFYPNTFHLFFFSLPVFPSVEVANKVLHLLTIVGLPLLVYFIIKELEGNKWFAIISFILIYGYNLTFGFTGNAVANNIILLILLLWLKTTNRDTNHTLYMIAISILLTVVYFLHAMVALFAILMMASFLLYRYKNDITKLILNSLCLLPLSTLIVYWWFFLQKQAESSTQYNTKQESTAAFLKAYYQHDFWHTYAKRANLLTADNFQLFDARTGKIAAFALSFIILVPFTLFIYNYLKRKNHIAVPRFFNKDFIYVILFFIINFICFFLLPSKIPGQQPLYERFSTMLLLSIILIGSKLPASHHKFFSYAAIILAFIHLALWAQYFTQFNQENKDFTKILPQDNTKILSYMNYDPTYRGRMVYDHFQNYFIVKKQGVSTSKVIDYRFGMIRRKESGGLPHQGHMYYHDSPRDLLLKSDYILVRGTIPPEDQRLLDSLNTFSNVKNIHSWHLLKRK